MSPPQGATAPSPVTEALTTTTTTTVSIEPSAAHRMISACAGSLVTSLLVTPLDVVKTRLQSQTVIATPTCAQPFTFSSNASAYEKLCQCCREVFAAPEAAAASSAGVRQNMANVMAFASSSSSSSSTSSSSPSLAASISRRIRPSLTKIQPRTSPAGAGAGAAAVIAASDGCGPSISQVHQEGTVVGMKASQVQQQRLERIAAHCVESGHVHHHAQERYFHGTWDGVKKIVKYEGVSSLWRGLSPTLLMSVPATVIYFVGYDYLKVVLADQMQRLDDDGRRRRALLLQGHHYGLLTRSTDGVKWFLSENREALGPLLAGGFARTVAATIISPLELFRTRMQSVHTSTKGNSGLLRGVFQGVVSMVRTEGVLSLWRGLAPTLWRDVPFSAIYWFGYEAIKRELLIQQQKQQQQQIQSSPSMLAILGLNDWRRLNDFEIAFLSGALSGMNAAILTTPFDVAKTRRQVDLNEPAHHRMWPLMRAIVREEGFAGLWRGLTARVAKVAPSCAIMISSYEVGKKALSEHWWGLGGSGDGDGKTSSSASSSQQGRREGGNGNGDGGGGSGGDGGSLSSGTASGSPGSQDPAPGSWVLMRDRAQASSTA
ncbi:hypothetical protein DFQ27_009785 [Actinomortierella ambigua]|uniref:Mitochondrial carrier protein n=1 Tax=Actinomortierella ambigua TaxID=1343610 RepID=A0A9P6QG26_9FUNG|nr:hypothetical protein DFQ27_009785 [Actinomortierella ambigua]